jgi:hypothetical protein
MNTSNDGLSIKKYYQVHSAGNNLGASRLILFSNASMNWDKIKMELYIKKKASFNKKWMLFSFVYLNSAFWSFL